MTIKRFCKKHDAFYRDRKWAMSLGIQSMEELWLRDDIKPEWRIWIATRRGVMSDKDLRLFACWCIWQVRNLQPHPLLKLLLLEVERFAFGRRDITKKSFSLPVCAATWEATRVTAWVAEDVADDKLAAMDEINIAQAKKLMEYDMCFDDMEA